MRIFITAVLTLLIIISTSCSKKNEKSHNKKVTETKTAIINTGIDFKKNFKGAYTLVKSESNPVLHMINLQLLPGGKAKFGNFESFYIEKATWIKSGNTITVTGLGSPDRKMKCEWNCQGEEDSDKCIKNCEQKNLDKYGKKMPDTIPVTYTFRILSEKSMVCDIAAKDLKPVKGKEQWDFGSEKNIPCDPFKAGMNPDTGGPQ